MNITTRLILTPIELRGASKAVSTVIFIYRDSQEVVQIAPKINYIWVRVRSSRCCRVGSLDRAADELAGDQNILTFIAVRYLYRGVGERIAEIWAVISRNSDPA